MCNVLYFQDFGLQLGKCFYALWVSPGVWDSQAACICRGSLIPTKNLVTSLLRSSPISVTFSKGPHVAKTVFLGVALHLYFWESELKISSFILSATVFTHLFAISISVIFLEESPSCLIFQSHLILQMK